MKQYILAAVCVLGMGCATTPSIGSSVWHEERVAEIEAAYNDWELTEEEYLELKNEADAIRSDYLNRLEMRRQANYRIGIGYGYGHYPHYWGLGYYPYW